MAPSNFAAEPRNLRTFVPMPRSTHSTTLVAHGHQQQHHHPTPLRLVLIQNVAACDHLLLRLLHQSLLLTLMMKLIQTLCKSGAPSAGPVDPGILSVVIVDAPSEDSASHPVSTSTGNRAWTEIDDQQLVEYKQGPIPPFMEVHWPMSPSYP